MKQNSIKATCSTKWTRSQNSLNLGSFQGILIPNMFNSNDSSCGSSCGTKDYIKVSEGRKASSCSSSCGTGN